MNVESTLWLTWREHRWPVIGLVVIATATAWALLVVEGGDGPLGSMQLAGFYAIGVQVAFGGVVGVVLGVPLLARELEERTYFVAWGQDVTAVEWLRGKMVVLGLLVAVLGAVVGAGDGIIGDDSPMWRTFEASPPLQAGYAVFGLALGVLVGLLTRHVATAMAATLVAYLAVRAVTSFLRDYFWPAQRDVAPWNERPVVPPGSLELGGGFVGEDLEPVPVTDACAEQPNVSSCMRSSRAASGTYVDYQPPSRIGVFQFVELGLYALLAAGVLVLTLRILRRSGGWKPTRSHRRFAAQSTPATAAAQTEG